MKAYGSILLFMRALIETARGILAFANWIFGLPLVNARIAYFAKSKSDGRKMLVRHCQRFLDTCSIAVEIEGPQPMPGRGCVLCYNESSFPDVMAYMVAVLDHVDRAAAANLYGFFPFTHAALPRVGFELVQRGNRANTNALIAKMIERIYDGERVSWGGEGRLSGINGVNRFKIGAGLIAIRAGAPVIPIAIHGGHQTMPLGSIRARPGTIRIKFGEPISTSGMTEDDARAFADHLQRCIADMYSDFDQCEAASQDN